ncbi:MAG: purine nucleoside permease [Lactobacillales bacterium]|nr:purine nucleoside permease [Lactobacillales bacterium]
MKVKFLVIAQFEPEFTHFYDEYFLDCPTVKYPALENPLYVNRELGMLGIMTGMCKGNSAATAAVVASDPAFDFSEALIISTGCAGGPARRVDLTDVVVCTQLADFDMGHHLSGYEDVVFKKFSDFDKMNFFVPSSKVIERVRSILGDGVKYGASLTSDNFWHGLRLSHRADIVLAEAQHTHGAEKQDYLITQCEDSTLAQIFDRLGLLDQFVAIRDVVNFDAPTIEGVSDYDSAGADSPAFLEGHLANFRITKKLIEAW